MSVLEQWKTARRLLTSTIQSYLAASATLRASCITPIRRPIEKSMAKEALSMIDSELESLALEEKKLCNMRISLTVARNNSATVVLVNTLPPEVLARIFAFSRTHCYYDYDYDYEKDNFSSVCGYWRQTALNATDLWTHVDIEHTTSRNLTRLLLDRSKNAPIYVHAYEREQDQAASGGYTPEYAANEIVAILRPHLHRVSSLEIESDNERDGFVYSLLERWSNHCADQYTTSAQFAAGANR
ncbi:hypothetical protein FRC09_006726 [Ceratobasidium sp. 395]|nr:hypothetical protein FRC09_006726 [Ceratobasidium sp. 395]